MPKRQYGTGSVTWLSTTKARLRVRVGNQRRSRVITVCHRDHGGRGQANEALARFLAEVKAELDRPEGGQQTVRQAVDAYVAQLERLDKSPSTIHIYRNVSKHLTDELAATRLEVLTGANLNAFYGALKDRGLASTTICTYHRCIRAALNEAVRVKWISANPANDATTPEYKVRKRHRLAPAEAGAMIERAQRPKDLGGEADPTLATAMFIAVYTGARRGELCGLKWEDYDNKLRLLTFRRQLVAQPGGQREAALKSDTGAIEGERPVTLSPQAAALLDRYRDLQRSQHKMEPEGWLLSYDAGLTPLGAQSLGMAITALGKKMGLNVTTHSFRRTSSTQLVAAGVDVDTASRRQGHTKQVMLQSYSLGADDRAVAAAEALEARLIEQGLPIAEILHGDPAQRGLG